MAAAAALYERRPTAADLAVLGMRASDIPQTEVGLWPENWPPLELFLRYRTQWRVGAAGPVGLDYNPILHDLDRRKLKDDEYDDMMDALRVIESAALEAINDA